MPTQCKQSKGRLNAHLIFLDLAICLGILRLLRCDDGDCELLPRLRQLLAKPLRALPQRLLLCTPRRSGRIPLFS